LRDPRLDDAVRRRPCDVAPPEADLAAAGVVEAFAPIKVTISPSLTVSETPFSAWMEP
jgi:hypothetical protein